MRTASEVAVGLVTDWDKSNRNQILSVALDSLKLDIENALTAFRNEAIDEATKVVETPIGEKNCYECDCHGKRPQEYYPPLIRALKK